MLMEERPSWLDERIDLMPAMPLIWSSTTVVTRDSTTSAEAPG